MPFKDVQRKKEWEQQHRTQRLARRRELRRIEAAREEARPEVANSGAIEAAFLLPLAGGSALVAYNPKLAIGTGGVALVAAALLKKGLSLWIFGALLLALGLIFHWNNK